MKIIKPIFLLFFVLSTIVFASSFSSATATLTTSFTASSANTLYFGNSNTITVSSTTLNDVAELFINNIEVANVIAGSSNSLIFNFNAFGAYNSLGEVGTILTTSSTFQGFATGNFPVGYGIYSNNAAYPVNVLVIANASNALVGNPIGTSLSSATGVVSTSSNALYTVDRALLSLQLSVLPSNSYTYNGLVPTIVGNLIATSGNILSQPSNALTFTLQNNNANTVSTANTYFSGYSQPSNNIYLFDFSALPQSYASASTYVFNALISGSNENYSISSSTTNTLTIGNTLVISSNSLLAPSYVFSNSSGSAFLNQKGQWVSPYYTLDAFKFTGAPTFNNQIKWNLYVNSGLSKTNTSVIKWATQGSPGTYTLTFSNAGNSNYTGTSITETLIVQQPASGSVSSSPPPVVITTTIPVTTTIPRIVKHIVNISTSSYNSLLNISTTPFTLNYSNENIILKLTSNSLTGINTTITISNATSIAKNMTNKNYTKLAAFNFNSSQNISINATYTYNCNLNNVSAFELVNNSWTKISSVVNASACTLSFAIPSDPIIGIFSYKPIAVSTTTTSTTTSTVPSNVVTTTAPITTTVSNITNTTTTVPISPVSSTSHSTLVIIAIIVIIIIIIAAVAYLMKKKK
ncbi:MAG: hypothetical protein QXP35_01240 [Candidatus Micrarchaeaceae archaeon]